MDQLYSKMIFENNEFFEFTVSEINRLHKDIKGKGEFYLLY